MTYLEVHVKPFARKTQVIPLDKACLRVEVTEGALKGKANRAVLKALAAHMGCAPSQLTIVKGLKSRIKRVMILS